MKRVRVFEISVVLLFGVLVFVVAFDVGHPSDRERWIRLSFPALFGVVLIVSALFRKDFILFEYEGKGLRIPAWAGRSALLAFGLWLLWRVASSLIAQ